MNTPPKSPDNETFPQYFNEDYDVIGILGRGGMGTVYKAIHKNLNREVALKVLEPGIGADSAESVRRFNLEAQAMKKLDHQNIVQVYDFGREGSQFFIAMTFAPGITLSDLLRKRRRLDIDETLLIIKQVARGLRYAHGKGIVHRDIKPSNIIIAPDNRVYITDFGISYIQDTDRLTNTGTAMGTPEYMSPEQCQGEEITVQSDLYSLGIIFYEMLTGDPPFTGVKPLDIAYKQVHSLPEPPSAIRPEVGKDIERVILQCLRKNRSERYAHMDLFLEDLDQLSVTTPTAPSSNSTSSKSFTRRIPSMISRKDRPEWLVPLAFGLIAVLTLLQVLLVLLQKRDSTLQFISDYEISAPWEQRSLETDHPKGYPLTHLMDNDIQTAWLAPIESDPGKPTQLSIRFPKPILVTQLGFAVGYQKAKDDALQDRFAMFRKPQTVMLRTGDGSIQKVSLQNVRGIQYPAMRPIETDQILLEFRDSWPAMNPDMDLALSELRILGIPVP